MLPHCWFFHYQSLVESCRSRGVRLLAQQVGQVFPTAYSQFLRDPSEIHGRFPAQPLRQANFDPVIRPKQFQSFRAAPVLVIQEDVFAAIPTVHDVIDRDGALNSKGSGHAARSKHSEKRHKTNVATWRTEPFNDPILSSSPAPLSELQNSRLKPMTCECVPLTPFSFQHNVACGDVPLMAFIRSAPSQ